MKKENEMPVSILANVEVFDYLKEKVGERKTRTEAYADLLDKSLAGFVSPFLRKQDYELRPCQCHVTVSDLASEWHWHRATVRSFLDTLEALGQLERTRLTKSVIITMPLQTGHAADSRNVQETPGLADQLRAVLSGWVIGKADSATTGEACGQLVRQAMDEAGVQDWSRSDGNAGLESASENGSPQAVLIRITAMECIALAAMERILCQSGSGDILRFMDFFRINLGGDWTSFIEAVRQLAESVNGTEGYSGMEDDGKGLESFRKTVLYLAARAQEAAYQTGGRKPNV